MTQSLDDLRRQAKSLQKAYEAGDPAARERVRMHQARPDGTTLKRADFLYILARESGFASWPRLKTAAEAQGLDRARKQQRLRAALVNGHADAVDQVLAGDPDIAEGVFDLQVMLLNREAVAEMLWNDPQLAAQTFGLRRPILHLAFSRRIHSVPDRANDMLEIAQLLLANGAEANDTCPVNSESGRSLSALYGALGHADNMALATWLLDQGADPNDGETLYRTTELGHHEGLRLLLQHGAQPQGTNALLRAMDFHDHEAVQMLLDAGADPDDSVGLAGDEQRPGAIPALHQAARRMSDRRMIDMLLDAGADPAHLFDGVTAYAYARVFGNAELAGAIETRGMATGLSDDEALLAAAAEGDVPQGRYLNPVRLPECYRNIIREVAALPNRLDHVRRLVAIGIEYDRPDAEGVTPVQIAGWEGLPEMMAGLIRLRPDLSHINGFGGTLLGTIIHGSENCPNRKQRNHVECLRLALEHGVALPTRAIELAAQPDVQAFLQDWAAAKPGQVVQGGIA